MATEWFIYREDERHGPFSSAEIRSLAQTGELQPNDCLWKEGMPKKRRAGSSAKLFPQAVPAAKTVADRPEAKPDLWFDDPRLVRPVFLIAGAAALLALVMVLPIMWSAPSWTMKSRYMHPWSLSTIASQSVGFRCRLARS